MTVLCGKGNNGGDGTMAARLLAEAGLDVTVILLGSPEHLAGDAAMAWSELTRPVRGQVHVVAKRGANSSEHNDALDADLIVDAVLGTGFKPPMKGLALDALEWLRAAAGMRRRSSRSICPAAGRRTRRRQLFDAPVFPADAVVTFTAPKPAHVFGQLTRRWDQPVVVAPIGSPDAAIVSELGIDWAGSSLAIAQAPRAAAANKGNFGHVLVVGGTFGFCGRQGRRAGDGGPGCNARGRGPGDCGGSRARAARGLVASRRS